MLFSAYVILLFYVSLYLPVRKCEWNGIYFKKNRLVVLSHHYTEVEVL